MKFSVYFTLGELTKSFATARKGLDNTPTPEALENLKALCVNVLDPIRFQVGSPIVINSAYRSPAVNKAVGGSAKSQHTKGEAADIECPGMSNLALAKEIIASGVKFDQLILEFHDPRDPSSGWVHVSYRPKGRREILTAKKVDGKTVYVPGLQA